MATKQPVPACLPCRVIHSVSRAGDMDCASRTHKTSITVLNPRVGGARCVTQGLPWTCHILLKYSPTLATNLEPRLSRPVRLFLFYVHVLPYGGEGRGAEVSFLLNQLGLGRLAGQLVGHATRTRGGEFESHVSVEVT